MMGSTFTLTEKIDDVGLFRAALSEQDINTIMVSGVGGFTGAARDLVITALNFGPGDGQVTITFDSVKQRHLHRGTLYRSLHLGRTH